MDFSIKGEHFILDGKKVFLNSGEIHYFRIKKEFWEKHLHAAKEAGLSYVSTYVPWAWHEVTEGQFDFDGHTIPERDLSTWLTKCTESGLKCILKPGPFILAEYRGAGLPDWFMDEHGKEVKMHNSHGQIVQSDGVSLFHPVYLEKLTAWYDAIMPFIRERQISKGGPVVMMQVCNEIGVFSWLAHQADYSEIVRKRFEDYLTEKFINISELNRLWKTSYTCFDEIELPTDHNIPYLSPQDRGRDHEWHRFWRKYYGDYLRMLAKMVRDRGVDVPLYHNLPGWIYGNGYEFPVNITMYEDLYEDKSGIIFGVDHIPEFLSYRNMHDDRIINDITYAMQGSKPLFAAEFQCGSREYHVVTNPRELELFYKASVANGLRGWNYYMFSQGINPKQKGYSGSAFYWFTPMTPEGERTTLYPVIQRMSQLVKTSEDLILNSERKAEIAVLFYPHYYATELERPVDAACGLNFNYSAIRRPAYFDGLLKVLQVLNIDYDMLDLSKVTARKMLDYKQIWTFSTDEMNASDQQKLVDYVHEGGNMAIFPFLPDREMSGEPCAVIRDAIDIRPVGKDTIDSPLLDILGFEDIKCTNPQIFYDENSFNPKEIIARNLNGHACGFVKSHGKGKIIHLGTWLGFDTEGHKPVYQAILDLSDAKQRQAGCDNEFIIVRERFTPDGSGILFIANYYNEGHHGTVYYTHPATGESLTIPYSGEKPFTWPALYGILASLNMKITENLNILHTSSDVLEVLRNKNGVEIRIYGDRDLPGEMVLEGREIDKILAVKLDEAKLNLVKINGRILLQYEHLHKNSSVIKILLNEN